MPAFIRARMESAYWNVYEGVFDRPAREPWRSMIAGGTRIAWIVGDVYADVLKPIAETLRLAVPSDDGETNLPPDSQQLVREAIDAWDASPTRGMRPVEKLRALLQLLYTAAGVDGGADGWWRTLIDLADAAEVQLQSSCAVDPEIVRDLHAFRAEACAQLHDMARAQAWLAAALKLPGADPILVKALLNASAFLARADTEAAARCIVTALRLTRGLDARTYDRRQLEARCHGNQAVIHALRGELVPSYRAFEKAERLFRDAGDLAGYASNAVNRMRLSLDLRLDQDAERCLAAARERTLGLSDERLILALSEIESALRERRRDQ